MRASESRFVGRSVGSLPPVIGLVRILRQSASATICSAWQRHGVIRSAHRLLIIDQISIELSTRAEALIARNDKISQQRAHEKHAQATIIIELQETVQELERYVEEVEELRRAAD